MCDAFLVFDCGVRLGYLSGCSHTEFVLALATVRLF